MIRKIVDFLFYKVDTSAFDRWLFYIMTFEWLRGSRLGAFLLKRFECPLVDGFIGIFLRSPSSHRYVVAADHGCDRLDSDLYGRYSGHTHRNMSTQFGGNYECETPNLFRDDSGIGGGFSDLLLTPATNPANGMPMVSDTMDILGNAYGTSAFD